MKEKHEDLLLGTVTSSTIPIIVVNAVTFMHTTRTTFHRLHDFSSKDTAADFSVTTLRVWPTFPLCLSNAKWHGALNWNTSVPRVSWPQVPSLVPQYKIMTLVCLPTREQSSRLASISALRQIALVGHHWVPAGSVVDSNSAKAFTNQDFVGLIPVARHCNASGKEAKRNVG